MATIPNDILERVAQLGSDPIYGQSNAALSQYYNLADQYEGLPATPEPKKRGFLGKLGNALPDIFAGLEYIAKSTSPSTRSQREAGDQLSTRMARISQIRDSRKMREQQELDKEHEKVLTALTIAGKKYEIENRKAQRVEEKNQAQKMQIRQSYLDSLNEQNIKSEISNREADNKRADAQHRQQTETYNAQRELYKKADAIRAYHAKNPTEPYNYDEIAVMKKAYPDFVAPEEQLQNFFADLTDQVDAEIKMIAQGEAFDYLEPEEKLKRIAQLKKDRMNELLAEFGMAPQEQAASSGDYNMPIPQGAEPNFDISSLLQSDPRLRGIGKQPVLSDSLLTQLQSIPPEYFNRLMSGGR